MIIRIRFLVLFLHLLLTSLSCYRLFENSSFSGIEWEGTSIMPFLDFEVMTEDSLLLTYK